MSVKFKRLDLTESIYSLEKQKNEFGVVFCF